MRRAAERGAHGCARVRLRAVHYLRRGLIAHQVVVGRAPANPRVVPLLSTLVVLCYLLLTRNRRQLTHILSVTNLVCWHVVERALPLVRAASPRLFLLLLLVPAGVVALWLAH